MLKRLFKGFIYFLGICVLVSALASACEDEEVTYIENVGPNEAVLVVPEEPDSEVEVVVPEEVIEPQEEQQQEELDIPIEYKQALKNAKSYLEYGSFSKEGLRDQLEFEEYTPEAIQFALDNVEVDWFQEAADHAESYLEYGSFSREGLRGQLEYEEYTPEEIEYALEQVYN